MAYGTYDIGSSLNPAFTAPELSQGDNNRVLNGAQMDVEKQRVRNRLLLQKEIYQILDGDTSFPVAGDTGGMPYLSGPTLSQMATQFGFPSTYDSRSRWCYVEDILTDAIQSDRLSQALQLFFNSPAFADHLSEYSGEEFERVHDEIIQGVIGEINKRLYFGGNRLSLTSSGYQVVSRTDATEVAIPQLKVIDRQYVRDLAKRMNNDVDEGRLDSALTKARTILEETFCYVIEQRNEHPTNKGDIFELYKQIQMLYSMHIDKDMNVRFKKLLSGLTTIVQAVSEMRNKNSDAHGVGERRVEIRNYHARVAVNAASSIAEFVLSVVEYANNN